MDVELDFPPWDLREVALIVVYPTDELSFLQANPTAIHSALTPSDAWDNGINWANEVLTNARSSAKSQAETDIPGAHPAVLLLRKPPKNGGAYTFGRGSLHVKPDVVLPSLLASRRHFCVYPNLLHRTWVIQDLSGRDIKVNDYTLSSKEEEHGQKSPWRALQYDRLNRVVFAQTTHHPGWILYIKPVWPEGSRYLQWDWQDPEIPELADLNLSWTLTSLTPTQSQKPQPQDSATPTTFCVLERRLCDNVEVFYGQDLDTGNEHLLKVSDVCLLDHPYILTACPFDTLPLADAIECEPLNDRTAYALFRGILSALADLYKNGIADIAISSANILVADLSPENPRFWLTGISSGRPISEDKIKERHSADVNAAMRIIKDARDGPDYFQDPAANAIFTGVLQALESKPLSATEILDKFETLTDGDAYFPFKSENLIKVFPIKLFQFGDQAYLIARALFARTAKGSQQAYTRVLSTKPRESLPGHEGEQLLHWEEAQTLFRRLDEIVGFGFWSSLEPARKKKRERGREEEREGESVRDFRIQMRITYHAPSKMWNLSQLRNAIPPTDLLEITDPNHYVEVGGDAECAGLYIDFLTFEHACRLLRVSPPPNFPESAADPRADQFRSVNSYKGDLVLADEKLLGTAIFKRSSRTMYYGGTEYSEANAVQLFTQGTFEGLHRGISQSRYPPQSLKIFCQGQSTQDIPESLCQSLTESLSEDSPDFTRRQYARPNPDQGQPENFTEE